MTEVASPAAFTANRHGGKLAVLAIFGLAAAMAAFAWWWNFDRGRRALEFYGAEAAMLIRTAPQVELLGAASAPAIDISRAPGLLNARTSLLADASYIWEEPGAHSAPPAWSVRFSDGQRSAVVAFDFETSAVQNSAGHTATLGKKTAEGWRKFLERQRKSPPSPRRASEG